MPWYRFSPEGAIQISRKSPRYESFAQACEANARLTCGGAGAAVAVFRNRCDRPGVRCRRLVGIVPPLGHKLALDSECPGPHVRLSECPFVSVLDVRPLLSLSSCPFVPVLNVRSSPSWLSCPTVLSECPDSIVRLSCLSEVLSGSNVRPHCPMSDCPGFFVRMSLSSCPFVPVLDGLKRTVRPQVRGSTNDPAKRYIFRNWLLPTTCIFSSSLQTNHTA